jgi:hypothetical protein
VSFFFFLLLLLYVSMRFVCVINTGLQFYWF